MTTAHPESDPISVRKSDKTRRRILDAAARTFSDKGYAATRLIDIAYAAGMQAGSLYYHFESKSQIFVEVLHQGIKQIQDAVQASMAALPESATHRDRIAAALAGHLRALLEFGDYTSANIRNFGQVPDEIRRQHIRHRRVYEQLWRDLLADAAAAGEIRPSTDLRLMRLYLLGALNWAAEWYDPGKQPIDEIARHMAEMLFDGVGT